MNDELITALRAHFEKHGWTFIKIGEGNWRHNCATLLLGEPAKITFPVQGDIGARPDGQRIEVEWTCIWTIFDGGSHIVLVDGQLLRPMTTSMNAAMEMNDER